MAKAIALGADLCGIALPFLRILTKGGISAVEKYVDLLKRDFTYALFLTGCRNITELKRARFYMQGRLKEIYDLDIHEGESGR
jgi:isopentenyl-diphosphate delta-isomerase